MTDATPLFHDQEERRLFYRELGLRSFFHFVRTFGTPVRQGGDISEIVHRPICDFISNDDIKRKGVAMPRKLRKTTICDRWFPIWCYLRDPEERMLLGAETLDIASASMDWIKDTIIGNSLLRWCYPEIAVSESWANKNKWSGVAINLPRQGTYAEPTIKALGVGGAGQSRHFTRCLLTDIFGEKGMNSEAIRLKTVSWWEGLPALLVDGVNGIITLDFTFWAVGDPHQYFMDTHPEYHWRIVPALKVDDATADKARQGNKHCVVIQNPDADQMTTNFPDIVFEEGEKGPTGEPKFPTETYLKMMASPEEERIFWTQHMNMPWASGSSTNTFLREWLRHYHIGPSETDGRPEVFLDDGSGEHFPLAQVVCYGFIDPGGFSENPLKGGRCAAMIVGRAPKGRKTLILWTWTKRVLRPSDLMKMVFEVQPKFNVRCWRIETTAQQRYIFRDLQEENLRRSAGLHILEYEIRDTSDNAKHNRIVSLKAPGENGEVYIQSSMIEFMAEWASHPIGVKDLLDCLSMYHAIYGTGVTKAPAKAKVKERYRAYLETKQRAYGGR